MLFAIYCLDKANHLQVRLDNRPAHLEHLKTAGAALKLGGPLLGTDGQSPVGSLIIYDAPDQAAVDAFVAKDPYTKAGLFQSVTVKPWKQVIGQGL